MEGWLWGIGRLEAFRDGFGRGSVAEHVFEASAEVVEAPAGGRDAGLTRDPPRLGTEGSLRVAATGRGGLSE